MHPESEKRVRPERLARGLTKALAQCAPGLLGLALFFLLASPKHGGATPAEGEGAVPPVCAGWHRGDGESQTVDLGQIERGYREFKDSLSQSLSRSLRDQHEKATQTGYDAGLAACTRGSVRRLTPTKAVPESLRGRRLWFFNLQNGKAPSIPREISEDPDATFFATKLENLEDLRKASDSLGRAVALAPRGIAEALGVWCTPAVVTISKEGEAEIHENP